MISQDPRERFLDDLSTQLRCGWLTRRRIREELSQHLDDEVADLRSSGVPLETALEDALKRLGDPRMIAEGFGAMRRARWKLGLLRSPAWVAVGVLSLVTAFAAELPQASGAQTPAGASASSPRPRPARRSHRLRSHPAKTHGSVALRTGR